MVIVNTIVIVRAVLSLAGNDVAVALGCFGGGSMVAALLLPRILDRLSDRVVMLAAALFLGAVLLLFATVTWSGSISWATLLVAWSFLGIGCSAVQTPTGRLLRRSAQTEDRPVLFAAQFALSHTCGLLTYPLAGWPGAEAGVPVTLAVLGSVTLLGAVLAGRFWPARDPEILEHAHLDLPLDHPHLANHHEHRHAHAFMIDDLHRRWLIMEGRSGKT